jgi:hypothetical protein
MSAGQLPPNEIDWAYVMSFPWLRVNAALILGIVDPIPLPSPMSEDQAAWVREHAWTPALLAMDRDYPYGFHRWCDCQRGTCWNCLNNRCDICVHRQRGGPDIATTGPAVTDRRGFVIAMIVLRDTQRPCRWTCRCPCPKTGPAPTRPRKQRTTGQRAPQPSHRPAPVESPDAEPLFAIEVLD